MSYTVINNSLLRELDVKGNTQLLLIHLISYESKEFGYAYPTLPTLLKDTGLSRNTILKCLNELEEKGYIKRVKEKGINNFELYALNNNENALKFYEKLGFRKYNVQMLYEENK